MNQDGLTELILKTKHLKIKKSLFPSDIPGKNIEKSIKNLSLHPKQTIDLKLINIHQKIFYGLVYYAKKYPQYRIAVYKFFVDLAIWSNGNELVDQKFLENYLLVTPSRVNNNTKYNFTLVLSGINLVESCEILKIWTSIVNHWLNKKAKYEGYWAFFSTLGGAYSSLGEESYEHAKNAEKISKKQLVLAHAFNDPNAICRCKLFLAFSYIQLTKFKEANFILRNEYKFLKDKEKSQNITDEKLRVMCIAGLKKLRFAIEQFRINNAYFSDRGKLRS